MSFEVAAIRFRYIFIEKVVYLMDSDGIEYTNWDKMIKWSSITFCGYAFLHEPTASIKYTISGIPMKIMMSTILDTYPYEVSKCGYIRLHIRR
jgi:hypothetical protein